MGWKNGYVRVPKFTSVESFDSVVVLLSVSVELMVSRRRLSETPAPLYNRID